MGIKQPNYSFSAWEDYETWESACSNCDWTGLLINATFEHESELISSLHCPNCDKKIALLSKQATTEEIIEIARNGSEKALRHLKAEDSSPE